jgi:hypothetical protein
VKGSETTTKPLTGGFAAGPDLNPSGATQLGSLREAKIK